MICLFPLLSLFVFSSPVCLLCSRKPSVKEKGSPSKSTGGKEARTDGVKESPSKVTKSLSFTDRNKAKHAFRMKDGASRQNSEGQTVLTNTHINRKQLRCIHYFRYYSVLAFTRTCTHLQYLLCIGFLFFL